MELFVERMEDSDMELFVQRMRDSREVPVVTEPVDLSGMISIILRDNQGHVYQITPSRGMPRGILVSSAGEILLIESMGGAVNLIAMTSREFVETYIEPPAPAAVDGIH